MSIDDYTVYTDVGNYYGEILFRKRNGLFVMELNNYDGPTILEISEEFFLAAKKEFEKK